MSKAYRIRQAGDGNANFRDAGKKFCKSCNVEFVHYNKTRKYCSWECYQTSGAAAENAKKNGALSSGNRHKGPHGTDSNQPEIVKGLRELGVSVFITADIGNGFPDLLCAWEGRNVLLEVKNSATGYGRKGVNARQKKWAEEWQGEKPFVVYTLEDAVKAVFHKQGIVASL